MIRIALFALVSLAAILWSSVTFFAQYTHLQHRPLIADINAKATMIDPQKLDDAIADYEGALKLARCNNKLYGDVLLISAYGAEMAMNNPESEDADYFLGKTIELLEFLLQCQPQNGKAWLDLAMFTTYREGFTDRAQSAYKQSAIVSPMEAWLAKERLFFALTFSTLFDEQAKQTAQNDIKTLELAAPFHLAQVLKAAKLKQKSELLQLF